MLKLFKLLLSELLVINMRLSGLLKELSDVILRVVRLSFLTEMIDSIGETNGNAFGLNSMRFFSKGFLEVDGILRALVILEGFSFRTSKYFWMCEVAVCFPLINPFGHLISLIPLYTVLRSRINLAGSLITSVNSLVLVAADDM